MWRLGAWRRIGGSLNKALHGAECELPADFQVKRGAIFDGAGGAQRATGNLVGYEIVRVGIPIGDPVFIKRYFELKEEEGLGEN
jgi:hypothetical protein